MHAVLSMRLGQTPLTAAFQERIAAARTGDALELEQARIRFTMMSIFAVYFVVRFLWDGVIDDRELAGLVLSLCTYFTNLAHVSWILLRPGVNHPRRCAAVLQDVCCTVGIMLLTDEVGVVCCVVCLWFVIGHGFRFGRWYLHYAQALTIACFTLMVLFSEYWREHLTLSAAVLLMLLAIPAYVSVLVSKLDAASRRLHEARAAAEHERVLARERQRIMADMHDGLGSSLVGLLGAVQSGTPPLEEIERRLVDALQELRLAVDALEPVDGDLGVVLGNVRHRMRAAIEDSGVKLHWQVGELPRLSYLTPRAILAVQRIVLEALTNALRHSQARAVTVSAQAQERWLRIEVSDDGVGFQKRSPSRGRGLDNLRRRAAELGGILDIQSSERAGASVVLQLPLTH
jgi:signal transduction histidine kinase